MGVAWIILAHLSLLNVPREYGFLDGDIFWLHLSFKNDRLVQPDLLLKRNIYYLVVKL
jgi:hypothetical protein